MKKILVIAITVLSSLSVSASNKSGATDKFASVKVSVPALVSVMQGQHYGVVVRSHHSDLSDKISWTVENGVLKIYTREGHLLDPQGRDLHIIVSTPTGADIITSNTMETKEFKRNWGRRMK